MTKRKRPGPRVGVSGKKMAHLFTLSPDVREMLNHLAGKKRISASLWLEQKIIKEFEKEKKK